jgi:SAM-dependent methyltransferase
MAVKDIIARVLVAILESRGTRYVAMKRWHPRVCSICEFEGRFLPYGAYFIRPDAQCPSCRSLERHRLLKIYFDSAKIAEGTSDVLHFAPEKTVRDFVEPMVRRYVTADLFEENVDYAWNIEAVDCESASFDVILCSHVLEHVKTDVALGELFRLLRPGGLAILMIPICEGLDRSYTVPDIVTPEGRWAHFQQVDHDRIIGRDFRDMVHSAGFDLTEFVAEGAQAVRHGLLMGERIFLARKPQSVS